MTNNSNEPFSRSEPRAAPHAPSARVGAAVLALSGLALLAGCAAPGPAGPSARAELLSRSGSSVTGAVDFVQRGNVLVVTGEIRGLKPNAEHGFHVHEKGDCSAADATSAGGHFNPGGHAHGRAGQGPHHAGDVPNLKADANGVARVNAEVSGLSISGTAPDGIIGRGLVVHRDPDDYKSQPAGNSGPRVACGVIFAVL